MPLSGLVAFRIINHQRVSATGACQIELVIDIRLVSITICSFAESRNEAFRGNSFHDFEA